MGRARASRPVPGLVLEVQVPPKMSVRAQIIKNGPNRVQNRRFGLKIGPEACQDRSGAFRTGPAAKKSKKVWPSRPTEVNGWDYGQWLAGTTLFDSLSFDTEPMGRLGQTFLLFFGRGTGPKRSGAVLACSWTHFQPKQSILDPFRAIFDVFGPI